MWLSCVKCEVKLSSRTEYVLFMQKTTQFNLNALASNYWYKVIVLHDVNTWWLILIAFKRAFNFDWFCAIVLVFYNRYCYTRFTLCLATALEILGEVIWRRGIGKSLLCPLVMCKMRCVLLYLVKEESENRVRKPAAQTCLLEEM